MVTRQTQRRYLPQRPRQSVSLYPLYRTAGRGLPAAGRQAGFNASVGSLGDAYDNTLAETINGLYKAEVIHKHGPRKGLDDVERATLTWLEWFNNRRLLKPIGDVPPAEYEMLYYQTESSQAA